MEYKTFEHIILKLQLTSKRDHKLYELGLDLSNISDDYQHIITTLLRVYYGEEGEDLISWWLYEDVPKHIFKKSKIIADLTTIEGLWKYIEKLRKSEIKPYIIPEPLTSKQKKKMIEDLFNLTNK